MFLKLSAKLYTSVFHHGLKVLSLKSSARHELGTQQCRRGKEPLGLRTEGPSQGWRPLPPSLCFLLTPQHWPEQVGKQQSCLYLRQRKQGQAPHSESSPISTLFYLFKIVCVCEPGMVASACNPITQEAEAGKALSKEKKKMISTELAFPCLSLHPGSAGLPATSPLPLTYLLYLNVNFPLVDTK